MSDKFRASRKRCLDDPEVIRHVFKAKEKKDWTFGNLGGTYLSCELCRKEVTIGDVIVQYYDAESVPESNWDTPRINITVCLECDQKELDNV